MLVIPRLLVFLTMTFFLCNLSLLGKSKLKGPNAENLNEYLTNTNARQSSLNDLKKADDLRLQTIKSIKIMINSKLRDEQKFELYLRLGELYAERHDYMRELEIRAYESRHDQWLANKKGREPKLSHKGSKSILYKAVDSFRSLVRNYPRHPRSDAAMFSLAKTLHRLENDNSIFFFKKLVRTYKRSQFLPESYLALGEHYFYKQDFKQAEKYYQSALKFKGSRVYTYSVYKLGWTYFNRSTAEGVRSRKSVDKAIAAFKLVVKLSERDAGKKNSFNLKAEAINDLIMVFAEYQRTDQALSYFERIGENDAFYDMLERMGNLYVENGENAKAVLIFNRLLKEAPTRKRNPEIYLTLAAIHDSQNRLPLVVHTFDRMNTLYGKDSMWTRVNSNDPDRLRSAKEKTQKNIHRYSTKYHKAGMKRNKNEFLRAALNLYNIYLKNYPNSDKAYELRYYLADIHFYFKNFDRSADEYFTVSKSEGKYRKKAAKAAVASMSNIIEGKKYRKLPPLGQVEQPIVLPKEKAKYVRMLDNFHRLLPKDRDGHPMRYSAAYTLFEYGHYSDSLKRLESIVSDIPKTKQGRASVKVILGYYTEKKQWDQLISVCRNFLTNKNIANSKLKIRLERTLRNSLFGQAVRLSKLKKYGESATAFIAYQKEFSRAKDADDALYNATLNYFNDGNVEEAITKGKFLIKKYPRSKHVETVTLDIAQSHESLADFENAAQYYENYSKAYPNSKKSRITLYNAATLYKGLKEYDKSIALYKRFKKFYPKSDMARDALFEIAQLYEKKKDYNSAVRFYQQHAWKFDVSSEEYLYSLALSADLQYRKGNSKAARKQFDRLYKKLVKKSSVPAFDARRIVARAMFADINSSFEKFQQIKFARASRIEKDVRYKQGRLKSIVRRYQRIIDLGSGEFTVASLYRVAEMNENFADGLLAATPPKGATQLQVDQFKSSMEKVAFPLKEEADSYFEMAYKRSKEVQTFTNWTRLARAKMTEIDAERYPLVNERNANAKYLSHRILWQEEVADLGN